MIASMKIFMKIRNTLILGEIAMVYVCTIVYTYVYWYMYINPLIYQENHFKIENS